MDNPSESLAEDFVSPRLKATSPLRSGAENRLASVLGSSMERTSWGGCRRVGSNLGLAFFAIGKKRRELAVNNIQMALGYSRAQAIRIARRSAQNWGMTTCEFLHLPGASPQEIRDYVSLEGLEHLQMALQGDKGAIVLTAHLGNWEILVARLAQDFDTAGVVRPLSNATMQEHMSSIRRHSNISLISKHDAGRPTVRFLKKNGVVAILPDRHAGANGALLPLFGRPTRFEVAPARFAILTGAPIVPIAANRRSPWLSDGRIAAHIYPSYTVTAQSRDERHAATIEGTRQVIASLEQMVRVHPDQWSWMLRRWRDDDIPQPE